MAPMPTQTESDTDCRDLIILTFPSVASLSSTAYHSALVKAAESTRHLCIAIVTLDSCLDSPESFDRARRLSAVEGRRQSKGKGKQDEGWETLQTLLMDLYTVVMGVYLSRREPLSRVDVVIQGMRGDLPALDEAGRRWNSIIRFEVSEIEHVVETLDGARHPAKIYSDIVDLKNGVETAGNEAKSVRTTALGGTFDHLHVGHKILLTLSAWITTERLIVGISDEVLLRRKKFPQHLELLSVRQEAVRYFLVLIKPNLNIELPPLQDVYGPTSTDPDIEVIVVSEETRAGGEAVNAERLKNGLSILQIKVINLMPSAPSSHQPTSLVKSNGDTARVEEIAMKMGSTGIREWIELNR